MISMKLLGHEGEIRQMLAYAQVCVCKEDHDFMRLINKLSLRLNRVTFS